MNTGYLYPDLPDASETTHWPPFQNATVTYIRNNFRPPYSERAQRLIAFLLGITSHSVADVIWHDLRSIGSDEYQGFIQSLAETDYNAQGQGLCQNEKERETKKHNSNEKKQIKQTQVTVEMHIRKPTQVAILWLLTKLIFLIYNQVGIFLLMICLEFCPHLDIRFVNCILICRIILKR